MHFSGFSGGSRIVQIDRFPNNCKILTALAYWLLLLLPVYLRLILAWLFSFLSLFSLFAWKILRKNLNLACLTFNTSNHSNAVIPDFTIADHQPGCVGTHPDTHTQAFYQILMWGEKARQPWNRNMCLPMKTNACIMICLYHNNLFRSDFLPLCRS